jgi:Fe-S cluster assembly protein SufD
MATEAKLRDDLDTRLRDAPRGGFTQAARVAARARLLAMGLPGRRDEYWRFTDPAELNAALPVAAEDPVAEAPLSADGALALRFDGGRAGPVPAAPAGCDIGLLGAADASDIHWAGSIYGTLEASGQMPVKRPFAALNTVTATEGLLLRVTSGKPVVQVEYGVGSRDSDTYLHHCIRVAEGAELTLIEAGRAGARSNIVIEVDLAPGARFHHIRAQGRDADRRTITHIFARISAGASFKSFTYGENGRLTRNEAILDIVGDHAVAHVAGVALGNGAVQPVLQDDTVFITHGAVGCESRQVYKKVLRNGATGVFQGKILVKPGAQKTDGYQISQSLLLDEDSQFLAKPELEIYADDVKCSHGSTTGAIDETALFYLRSRGVGKDRATALLVLSFLADAIAEIEDPALADQIVARLEDWLGLGEAE